MTDALVATFLFNPFVSRWMDAHARTWPDLTRTPVYAKVMGAAALPSGDPAVCAALAQFTHDVLPAHIMDRITGRDVGLLADIGAGRVPCEFLRAMLPANTADTSTTTTTTTPWAAQPARLAEFWRQLSGACLVAQLAQACPPRYRTRLDGLAPASSTTQALQAVTSIVYDLETDEKARLIDAVWQVYASDDTPIPALLPEAARPLAKMIMAGLRSEQGRTGLLALFAPEIADLGLDTSTALAAPPASDTDAKTAIVQHGVDVLGRLAVRHRDTLTRFAADPLQTLLELAQSARVQEAITLLATSG